MYSCVLLCFDTWQYGCVLYIMLRNRSPCFDRCNPHRKITVPWRKITDPLLFKITSCLITQRVFDLLPAPTPWYIPHISQHIHDITQNILWKETILWPIITHFMKGPLLCSNNQRGELMIMMIINILNIVLFENVDLFLWGTLSSNIFAQSSAHISTIRSFIISMTLVIFYWGCDRTPRQLLSPPEGIKAVCSNCAYASESVDDRVISSECEFTSNIWVIGDLVSCDKSFTSNISTRWKSTQSDCNQLNMAHSWLRTLRFYSAQLQATHYRLKAAGQ